MNDKPKCCATVWPATGRHKSGHGPLRQAQCRNSGTVQRGGKWYCGVHDPVARRERANKRLDTLRAKFDAEREARRAQQRKTAAAIKYHDELVAALKDAIRDMELWSGRRNALALLSRIGADIHG